MAMRSLAAAVAVVTGAGGGIGGALARSLAAQGATVWLVGRTRETLEATADACGAASVRVHPTDLTDDGSMDALVREIQQVSGQVDVLVHSAGVVQHGTIDEAGVEDLDLLYRSNVRPVYRLSQGLLPLLRRSPGQIVVINSSIQAGVRAGISHYVATQHALRAMTDTLRVELNHDGIRVLSVFPGRTATPRQAELFEGDNREYRPELLLQPEDLATMVVAALTLPPSAEVTDLHIRPMSKSY
jgi:NADP-dependent 3-hydroxy acid dehydrogenase YdfG